jgi:hypothetical protein
MVDPWLFVLLALIAYRVTRFLVDDSAIGGNYASGSEVGELIHRWARDRDGNDRVWWRGRLADLAGCTYCLGFWVSLTVVCLRLWAWPWQLGADGWTTAIALAGAQALLNAIDHKVNA